MIPVNSKPVNSYPLYSFPIPGSVIVYAGILKRWNGSAWVKSILKVWNGTSFVEKPLKIYSDGSWGNVDTSGT